MNSLLCNWFDDWGRAILKGLTPVGVIVFLVAFSCVALCLIYSISRGAVSKPKLYIKWGQVVILIIMILFIIWFSIIL